jgi:hypothetical protein
MELEARRAIEIHRRRVENSRVHIFGLIGALLLKRKSRIGIIHDGYEIEIWTWENENEMEESRRSLQKRGMSDKHGIEKKLFTSSLLEKELLRFRGLRFLTLLVDVRKYVPFL